MLHAGQKPERFPPQWVEILCFPAGVYMLKRGVQLYNSAGTGYQKRYPERLECPNFNGCVLQIKLPHPFNRNRQNPPDTV